MFPLAILAVTYFMMLWSDRIYSVLGDSGTAIAARIMGLVLAALAVEMVIEGIRLAFDIQ